MIDLLRSYAKALAAFASIVGFVEAAHAVQWRDDFNDGSIADNNPVPWITNLGGFFPGSYDASSGDLILTPAVDGSDASQMSGLVPVGFSDTYVRTQGKVLPDPLDPETNRGGNLVVLARVDPEILSGYLMYFDVAGNLNLQRLEGGATTDIGVTFDAPFNASSEVVIELNVVGDQLSGYAWEANDPNGKPSAPQVTATDSTFRQGIAGIAYAEDNDFTIGVFRFAAAQDAPFVDASQGDFDNDNDVDGHDFLIWERGFSLTGQTNGSTGDADGDGDVDGVDYDVWSNKLGSAPGVATATAIPEATTLALSALGVLVAASASRRTRRTRRT